MLATMVVTDLGDGSLASLAGDGLLSLREAVEAINTGAPVDGIGPSTGQFGSADAIIFSPTLFGGMPKTLTLTTGQLELQSGVIVFGPGSDLLTLDAQQNSRLFDIAAGSDNFVIAQVTLTGGLTIGVQQPGGAVRSKSTGRLTIASSAILESATTGASSPGGAISAAGEVILVDSQIANNYTENSGGGGGGIFSFGDISLIRSSIADNRTEGTFASGGGLSSNTNVTLNSSTVSGNRTLGLASSAGGILAIGNVELTESTVSGNQTAGNTSSGGGVSSSGGTITVTRSTVVNNQAPGANASGGGLQTVSTDIFVTGSIIANNTAGGGNADIQPGTGTLTVDYSLVGDATGLGIPAATNLLDQNPLLGLLAENGGPTPTHAPLPGSPVIDAGDALVVSAPLFDQRGAPFSRIADGDGNGSSVIDLGSYEVPIPAPDSADFDEDTDIDGSDFLAWQRGFGKQAGVVRADGDADGDLDVDDQDLATWQSQYGGAVPLTSLSVPLQQPTISVANLIDLAIAVELGNAEMTESNLASLSQATSVAESSAREQAFATISPSVQAEAVEVEVLASAKASQKLADGYEGLDDELVVTSL